MSIMSECCGNTIVYEPGFKTRLIDKLKKPYNYLRCRFGASCTCKRSKEEFDILEQSYDHKDADERPIVLDFKKEILALIDKFGKSGQSGGSAPFYARAISNAVYDLCMHQPLCGITGDDQEWSDTTRFGNKDTSYQNKRLSSVFKESKEAQPYYLYAITWKGESEYDTFSGTVSGISSSQYIKKFPFKPKTFYIDVVKEILPEDWTEEPFYEFDYYSNAEFEKTGVKNWKKQKYRYSIKDMSQLDAVFEYYDKKSKHE